MNAGRISSACASGERRLAIAGVALLCTIVAVFALNLPELSGRVVDQANIIPADTRDAMASKLADLEAKSGIQLVVATVGSLEDQEIEPYANQLFRSWQLGEKTKNNGVLLLVAPNQRRVRIEVGYGLEGTLTDALSKVIIANAITPRFKAGDFGGGIVRGVDDIITVLTTDAAEWQKRPALRLDNKQSFNPILNPAIWLVLLFLFIFIFIIISSPNLVPNGQKRGSRRSSNWGSDWGSSSSSGGFWSSGSSSSGDSGGGFSGGGGDSGGGGASGSW
jgi:uncharacterized protein